GAIAVFGVDDRLEQVRVSLPLLCGVAEHWLDLGARVHVRLRHVERPDVETEGKLLDERAVPPFRLGELTLGFLALGDGPTNAARAGRNAVPEARPPPGVEPADAAVCSTIRNWRWEDSPAGRSRSAAARTASTSAGWMRSWRRAGVRTGSGSKP